MKPIENNTITPFRVGMVLNYLGDDCDELESVTILKVKVCKGIHTCYHTDKCSGYLFDGDDDNVWCGIPEDFEVVSE